MPARRARCCPVRPRCSPPGWPSAIIEQTSVHGYKFNDLNDNGVDNSEPRLAGWTIVLVGTNGQGNAVSDQTRRRGPTASIRSPAWRRGRTR